MREKVKTEMYEHMGVWYSDLEVKRVSWIWA
jgi:hypothetical protein